MNTEPNFERLRATVRHEEPDRVPLFEALIDYSVQSTFLGRDVAPDDLESQVAFWAGAGYDFIPLTVGAMKPGKVTDESAISKVLKRAAENERDGGGWNLEYRSFISNRDEFDAFPWDSFSEMDLSVVEKAASLLPPGMKVVALSGKIYTLSWMLMGFNNFCVALRMDEQLLADVVERIARIQMRAIESIIGMPSVGAVWVVDDMAFNTGAILPPETFREYIFPWYTRMAQMCHDNGLLMFMHSDGDLTSLMEDIIGAGVDLLHPIDPSCMDIVALKQQYGDRIALAGNISNEMLCNASRAEIGEEVKRLLRHCGPGGGYCIGSGNSVPDWASYENYTAMRKAALRFGKYPIRC